MKFKEFVNWCNERACDGCWGMLEAIACINLKYYINIATQSVHMIASDVHFTSISRNASWDAREIRAR